MNDHIDYVTSIKIGGTDTQISIFSSAAARFSPGEMTLITKGIVKGSNAIVKGMFTASNATIRMVGQSFAPPSTNANFMEIRHPSINDEELKDTFLDEIAYQVKEFANNYWRALVDLEKFPKAGARISYHYDYIPNHAEYVLVFCIALVDNVTRYNQSIPASIATPDFMDEMYYHMETSLFEIPELTEENVRQAAREYIDGICPNVLDRFEIRVTFSDTKESVFVDISEKTEVPANE